MCSWLSCVACMRAQTIKTWYKLMPEALGRKLAQKRGLGVKMPEKERQKREEQTEVEYLRKEGYSKDEVGFGGVITVLLMCLLVCHPT